MSVSSTILLLLALNGALLLAVFLMFVRIEHHLDRLESRRRPKTTKTGTKAPRSRTRGD